MSVFEDLADNLLYVTFPSGIIEAVESANAQLSNSADTLCEFLDDISDKVDAWEADIDNGYRQPSYDDLNDFVNDLKDQVEEWVSDNR